MNRWVPIVVPVVLFYPCWRAVDRVSAVSGEREVRPADERGTRSLSGGGGSGENGSGSLAQSGGAGLGAAPGGGARESAPEQRFGGEAKVALLIANSDYRQFGRLANPAEDMSRLSEALTRAGFKVITRQDATREQMLDALTDFEERLRRSRGIGFFHYGGHGVQVDGKNYLIPVDADIPDERRVSTRALDVQEVTTSMERADARVSVVVLDACRDNPLPKVATRGAARGLAAVEVKPKNSVIVYSADAGNRAMDGVFTPILSKYIDRKDLSLVQMLTQVRRDVYEQTRGNQTPAEYNQLFDEVFLALDGAEAVQPVVPGRPMPKQEARPVFSPATQVQRVEAAVKQEPGVGSRMNELVRVTGGKLPARSKVAGTVVGDFEIGKYEVTWGEWRGVSAWSAGRGYDVSVAGVGDGDDYPVQEVSWYDAVKWCNARSEKEGLVPVYVVRGDVYRSGDFGQSGSGSVTMRQGAKGYRLPLDAEWEWAARGGVKSAGFEYSGSSNLGEVGWFSTNSGSRIHAVGERRANELGIHDMSGNVWEWCWDAKTVLRRFRGGSWYFGADYAQVSNQRSDYPSHRGGTGGFRVARTP